MTEHPEQHDTKPQHVSGDTSTAAYQSLCASMSYEQFMKHHVSKPGEAFTHTRIGDKALNIGGGVYTIPPAVLPIFWSKYYSHVFENGKQEYLTEKQNPEQGPVMVDFDFRYETSITKRQHTKEHIVDMVGVYFDTLATLVEIPHEVDIPVYIFEKGDVNQLDDVTKDGIHMMIGLIVDRPIQRMLRSRLLKELPDIWTDLPITNTWNDVLDEGISRGHTNWQLYGSRKPGHKAYMMKYQFVMTRNKKESEDTNGGVAVCSGDGSGEEDCSWSYREEKTCKFNVKDNFAKLSVQSASSDTGIVYNKYSLLSGNTALKAEFDGLLHQQKQRSNGGGGGTVEGVFALL